MSERNCDVQTVDVDGVTVEVSTARRVARNKGSAWHDVVGVRAPSPGCGDLTIDAVAGPGLLGAGNQGVVTGVAAFDDRYVVGTSDARVASWWLGAAEAAAMATTYDRTATTPFHLHLVPGVVNLGATNDAAVGSSPDAPAPSTVRRIDEAVRAAGFIAGRNQRLAAQWRARLMPLGLVDAGTVWRTDDAYALVVERGRARIAVDFPWRARPLRRAGLRTRLMMPWDAAEPVAVAAVPPELAALGADWCVRGGGALAVGWERIVEASDRLAAALTLLARWAEQASGATGPYR